LKLIDSNITKHLPKITLDYVNNDSSVFEFYGRDNQLENYQDQILDKKKNYNNDFRKPLTDLLASNYKKVPENSFQNDAINKLKNSNTFTVTTGHQLNLFTGPLYFFYKIIDAINLCKKLKHKYPKNEFIPIYWMASEDHDYKEINFFKTNNKKFHWDVSTKGAVGHLEPSSLDSLFNEMIDFFGNESINSKKLLKLFKNAYLNNDNLSDATFDLVHSIFGRHGLLILNPDDAKLKKIICADVIDEIKNNNCYNNVTQTNKSLVNINIKPQVNPREINLFYLKNNLRSRIQRVNSVYKVLETDFSFSENQIINEINNFPERFSPNVLFRPFFQEKILPNLAYVGGGSEIAYWLQLKNFFISKDLLFPILVVRNSVLLVSQKIKKKCKKLEIQIPNIFKNSNELSVFYISKIVKEEIDLTSLKKSINDNFNKLYEFSLKTDKSFLGSLKAQEIKQLKGIENLEKKLIKAHKKKHKEKIERLKLIKEELFPNNSLQEREINFSHFYLNHGDEFIDILMDNLNPFENKFLVISL